MGKLKGVCRIELTDVKTGEKKVTVDKNVITDAINQIFSLPLKYALVNANPRLAIYPQLTPARSRFTGVILLKDAISGTDNQLKAKTAFPLGSAITGHAGNNTTLPDADLTCGVWNSDESGEVENGYKYVWDFPTDRANGDISCVCLTAGSGGYYTPISSTYRDLNSYGLFDRITSYSYLPITFSSSSDTLKLRPIGIKGDKLICVSRDTTVESLYTVELDPQLIMDKQIWGISKTPGSLAGGYETHALSTGIAGNLSRFCDGYIYQLSAGMLKKIDPETFEQVGSGVSISDVPYTNISYVKSWWVKDNHFYVIPNANRKTVKKINLADTSDVETLSLPQSAVYDLYCIYGEINGKILLSTHKSSYSGSLDYLIEGSELLLTRMSEYTSEPSYYTTIMTIPGNNLYFVDVREITGTNSKVELHLYRENMPAMTIDNLQTPVTKTNATTMKIIYTITNESEEEE